MKNTLFIAATCVLVSVLTACSEKVRDIPYYIDHPDEREKVIKDCYNNPGQKAGSPNCINAIKAHDKITPHKMPSIKSELDDCLDDYVDTLR